MEKNILHLRQAIHELEHELTQLVTKQPNSLYYVASMHNLLRTADAHLKFAQLAAQNWAERQSQ